MSISWSRRWLICSDEQICSRDDLAQHQIGSHFPVEFIVIHIKTKLQVFILKLQVLPQNQLESATCRHKKGVLSGSSPVLGISSSRKISEKTSLWGFPEVAGIANEVAGIPPQKFFPDFSALRFYVSFFCVPCCHAVA